ncbi:ribonuclease Z [Litoribacillus peritrichatus]
MQIQFLGTSSGTPTKARNVSGLAIKKTNSKSWCLVDCGEGTQHRLLETNLTLKNLQAIFITHIHGDHCYGLPGVLASAAMAGRTAPLWLVAPAKIRSFVEGVIASTELWLNFEIQFVDVAEASSLPADLDFKLEVIQLSHRVPSFGYAFSEKVSGRKLDADQLRKDGVPSGPLWGQLQQGRSVTLDDGRVISGEDYFLPARVSRKIIIAGDNDNPDLLSEAMKNAHVLVHEATYTHDVLEKIGPGPQHSSAKLVADSAEKNELQNLVLTHFSPRYGAQTDSAMSINDIENEARNSYSGHLFLANDLDCFELQTDGSLAKV